MAEIDTAYNVTEINFDSPEQRDLFMDVVFPDREGGETPGFFWCGRHTISCFLKTITITLLDKPYQPTIEDLGEENN